MFKEVPRKGGVFKNHPQAIGFACGYKKQLADGRMPTAKKRSSSLKFLVYTENIIFVRDNKFVMRTVQIKVPDSADVKDYDILMIVAAKLYETLKLSAGQAAEMVGLSKRAFIEMLGKYNVSVFSTSVKDLHSDIENA